VLLPGVSFKIPQAPMSSVRLATFCSHSRSSAARCSSTCLQDGGPIGSEAFRSPGILFPSTEALAISAMTIYKGFAEKVVAVRRFEFVGARLKPSAQPD
jgi:hypothetical protein